MRQARPLFLVVLLAAASLAALAPPASAASTEVVTRLGIADAGGLAGIVGHSAVHLDGVTYIFGGRLPDNTYSDQVYRFDHATGKATAVATIPAVLPSNSGGRYSATAFALGSKIYYMGGAVLVMIDINGDQKPDPVPQSSADIFEFDPATNRIDVLTDKLPRSAWGLASAVATPTKAYIFGGFTFSVDASRGIDASRRDWVVEFDSTRAGGPTAPRARELVGVTLPYAMQDAAAARIGSTIYLFGGLTENNNQTNPCPMQDFYGEERPPVCRSRNVVPFDVGSGVVRVDRIREMPYRAQFIGAAVVNGKAYVPGGLLADDSPATTILEFDPAAANPLRVLTPTLPRGIYGAGVVTDGTSIFAFGGRHGGHNELTDEVVRIDVSPTIPWAPRAAQATPIAGGLRLSWEAPAYDGDSPVGLYRVYRSGDGEDEKLLKETGTLVHDDLTVKAGAAYVYRITALNAKGESNASARVSVNSGTTPPGPVEDFEAYAGDREVLLRWRAPTDLGGANLSGYRVLRDGQVVTTLPPTRTEHRDEGLANGVAYAYSVRAYNTKGDGASSPVLRVSPAAVPPSPSAVTAIATETAVSLSWEPPASDWEKFVVYRSLVSGVRGERIATITTLQYVDDAVQKGRTYHYQVATANAAGESVPSAPATVSLVRTPGAPGSVQAIGLEGEIRVTWQPPTDTGDAPLENVRYYVTRASAGSPGRIVASDLKGTTYVDRTVQPGVQYAYTVTALNPQPSAPSAEASATAKELVNKPPKALVNVIPPIARAGEAVQIDASLSSDEDGVIRNYVYDFGDGTNSMQSPSSSVSHAYDRNGTYTIKVIVTDDRNADDFVTTTVVVGEPRSSGGTGDDMLGGTGGGGGTGNNTRPSRPGSETPDVPGPGAVLVVGAALAAALVLGRRRRA